MKIGLVPEWPSRPRGVTRAPDRWRAAANVLAARWDMFLHAEAEVPGLRLLLTSPRWTPKRPPRRSWVSSLRSPPDSHDQLVSSAPGRSTNSPVPRLRPVTYAMLGASARQPLQPTARNAGKVRAQPMCGSQRPLALPARPALRRRIACRGAPTLLRRARSDRGPIIPRSAGRTICAERRRRRQNALP
jgi:hypothetical protein